jgi:hypothetical protein
MPWHRWKDPSREGVETEIRTTSGRVVRGRVVSHGVEVDDPAAIDLAGREVRTTIVDEHGRYYTGRELTPAGNLRHAAA